MKKSESIDLKIECENSPAFAGLSRNEQPIAALASGSGAAAVSIIRISGAGSFSILGMMIRKPMDITVRQMYLGELVDPQDRSVLDELMYACFKGPKSFTGEDSVELFCHGGPYIVNRILDAIFRLGARPADPGEFTRRAFLNGKMDLTEAEGIKQLVEAGSHQQWVAARQLATGTLHRHIEELRVEIIGAMAYLEARIDFPDEGDTQGVALEHVESRVRAVQQKIDRLLLSYDSGRIASQGLKVAIIGAPNMGKSSLMNALLRKERAIVTEIAGTTRDYIEEPCLVQGRLIRLIDTAGMRETNETVEQIGVKQAEKLAKEADLVIALTAVGATEQEQQYFNSVIQHIDEEKCLRVINKMDRSTAVAGAGYLPISCHTEDGLEKLREDIASRVDESVGNLTEAPFVTSARHKLALDAASEGLCRFFDGVTAGLYEEMLAFELQHVVRPLSGIIGEVEHDDLLDRIFSEFCVGK